MIPALPQLFPGLHNVNVSMYNSDVCDVDLYPRVLMFVCVYLKNDLLGGWAVIQPDFGKQKQ